MTHFPAIDLSIVTFNSERWLDAFWDSLVAQSYPLSKISLFFRDNGSTDGTVAALRALIERHQGQFARIVLECGENVGFGRGHNANLASGSADFFLVTNVDLTFDVPSIARVMGTAIADDDAVAGWEFRQKPYEHPKYYNPVTLETNWASSACMLFRRSALTSVGGYEPRLFLYGEDVELSYRLRDRGYRLKYCPAAVCWHFTYAEAGELKPAQFFGSTLANVLLRFRYGTLREVFAGFAMYCAILFVPLPIHGRLLGLFTGMCKIARDGVYFLRTRKRSDIKFSFRAWDYELSREGPFVEYVPPSPDAPLVSIVVRTTAGRHGKLVEAVRSVQNQTYANVELVVVEDGSSEAQPFVEQVAAGKSLANVQYHSIPKGGRCVAGNVGLAAAKGEYACFLDDDDLLFADHVELLATHLRRRPDLAGAYSLAFQVETEVISHEPWRYRAVSRFVAYRERFSRAAIWHHNFIPIQAILFRRTLFDQYGGFNVQLDRLEDWDLWVRYCQRNDFELVEKITSEYRVPADGAIASSRQQELDDYYLKAVQARDAMVVQMTPNQVMEYAEELAKIMYPIAVSRSRLRAIALRIPGIWVLRRMYMIARGILGRIRRKFVAAARRTG
ncbi:glycosyltransferase family 2 protein [Burkholderia ubonensis]|uniref:glycosyltransferase family 2 protein n=1 Tax=Burkholderia ubonensis TaxID=101571 RepID=UPI0018DFA1CC|nr:glycosyltransferase family 2 protein [Burkholderia ubonensis]